MAEKEEQKAEVVKRWKLLLNIEGPAEDESEAESLSREEVAMSNIMEELYHKRKGQAGFAKSQPKLHKWLGDIRTYFPTSVVRMMQKDAIDKHEIDELLLEPEILENITPDVHLVATLLSLQKALPDKVKESARQVVEKLVQELEQKFRPLMLKAVSGRINRSIRQRKPAPSHIDWNRVIRANLKNYQPEYNTIIPEKWYGFGHKQRGLKHLVLLVDQSASMSESVVYASIYASVLAGIKTLKTHLILFDTSVVDMTPHLDDPIEVLFGSQLGGGTNINKALQYSKKWIEKPRDTHFFLISDMDEGGDEQMMLQTLRDLKHQGVNIQILLNLSDEGKPYYSERVAQKVANLDIPAFACTPDRFPDLVAEGLFG
jgi:Mg-chelatase subunit ChlD